MTDVRIAGLTFLSGTAIIDSDGSNITIENSQFASNNQTCIEQSGNTTLSLNNNAIHSCQLSLGSGATDVITSLVGNTFTSTGSTAASIFSSAYSSGSSLYIQGNTFHSLSGSAIAFSANATILQNTFVNTCGDTNDCAVLQNLS